MTYDVGINESFAPLMTDESRYLYICGGAGSGKSVFVAQKILARCLTTTGNRFLVVRKIANTIEGSCFALFKDITSKMGISHLCTFNKSPYSLKIANGNEILFRGLDDQEKIKSIQGITSVWVEEATELNHEDHIQLMLRVRGETKTYKQTIYTFNPINESHWLKTKVFDSPSHGERWHFSTYKDNAFLDKQYIDVLNEQVAGDENMYRIYVLGQWGKLTTGSEFYFNYKRTNHVADCDYNPSLPLHVTFDFNVVPYITATIWQVENVDGVYQIRCVNEYCLKNPRNNTAALCQQIAYDYSQHRGGMFIYGDATGNSRSTQSTKTNYDIIMAALRQFVSNSSYRVPRRNPPLMARREFINKLLFGAYKNLSLQVDSKCINMIADLENVQEDENGGKLKARVRDANTKQTYEQYGHTSDSMDYFLCTIFENHLKGK